MTVYTPPVDRVSAFAIFEDHLNTSGLTTTVRYRGVGLSWHISSVLTAQADFRYVDGEDGYLEHRYTPALTARFRLPAEFDLTSRTEDELRDVRTGTGPEKSSRLRERLTLSRDERIAGVNFTPFAAYEPMYDSRYHYVNKHEELVGVRLPRGPVSTELYGEWWQDPRGATPHYASVGVMIRVTT